ncbi:PD-(D/E)XK motif protein [Alteromonas facilis]|uniref:PD-(D/E)XK motif protein n=1 Tax=Alteromonas facilis TaxID=2048004 RepID=UPI000C292D62|nr:PD-(D/E)XK motif protein [Alteromonas facilis]
MIDFSQKWDDIELPLRKNITTRIAADHALDLLIGYSETGCRQLKLRSEEPIFDDVDLPEFENIRLGLNVLPRVYELNMVLENNDLKDLFSAIAFDLVNASSNARTKAGAADIFINRLNRWADLLQERFRKGLSLAQQLGLLGELSFLKDILKQKLVSNSTAIAGWRGPDGDARDISLGAISIEVKASLATSKNALKISSLDQLDTVERRLVVSRYQFSKSDTGVSLSSLVEQILFLLKPHSPEKSDFWRKLYLLGYDPDSNYVESTYTFLGVEAYSVESDFPRLVPSNVAQGIRSVSYEIDCSLLSKYLISDSDLKRMLNGK